MLPPRSHNSLLHNCPSTRARGFQKDPPGQFAAAAAFQKPDIRIQKTEWQFPAMPVLPISGFWLLISDQWR